MGHSDTIKCSHKTHIDKPRGVRWCLTTIHPVLLYFQFCSILFTSTVGISVCWICCIFLRLQLHRLLSLYLYAITSYLYIPLWARYLPAAVSTSHTFGLNLCGSLWYFLWKSVVALFKFSALISGKFYIWHILCLDMSLNEINLLSVPLLLC